MMDYYELGSSRFSYQDSLKILEADIQHANMLAASIPRAKRSPCLQMKLVSADGKPKVSSCGRKATIREFYTIILPSLQRLHCDQMELNMLQEGGHFLEMVVGKRMEDGKKFSDLNLDRENECGICLEPCTKMVVPSCCHEMCINCYRDWNTRSESCPFCRGSLKRVNSVDFLEEFLNGSRICRKNQDRSTVLLGCKTPNCLFAEQDGQPMLAVHVRW